MDSAAKASPASTAEALNAAVAAGEFEDARAHRTIFLHGARKLV